MLDSFCVLSGGSRGVGGRVKALDFFRVNIQNPDFIFLRGIRKVTLADTGSRECRPEGAAQGRNARHAEGV